MGSTFLAAKRMRNILFLFFLISIAHSASASSSDAWRELYKKTAQACLQASGLKDAKLIGAPTIFAHAVLYRINGIWPQLHMKGRKARVYCLHPYPDGMPEIVERH